MPIGINGSGTITGISAGGLPDATVTPADLTQPLTLMTAQTASGTSIDFTGIPSWVRRITVIFKDVSTNGTSNWLIRLGTGSTPTYATSGYLGSSLRLSDASTIAGANYTAGFGIAVVSAAAVLHGSATIVMVDPSTNAWAEAGTFGFSSSASMVSSNGSVALSGALTAVRITTVNGTETFDAGTINILYEG